MSIAKDYSSFSGATEKLAVRLRAIEMDEIIRSPELLKVARQLTISPDSGMNEALNHYIGIEDRSIDAFGIFAYHLEKPIGWALFTYESDNFDFTPEPGYVCAHVYVKPIHRRRGVGTQLIGMCEKLAQPDILCVYEWSAREFFKPLIKPDSYIRSIDE
jgi:GNAT superfamily N-acetyltransferase